MVWLSEHSFIHHEVEKICRICNVRMIRSENGSNMVGASTKLIHAFREVDHIKIGNFL